MPLLLPSARTSLAPQFHWRGVQRRCGNGHTPCCLNALFDARCGPVCRCRGYCSQLFCEIDGNGAACPGSPAQSTGVHAPCPRGMPGRSATHNAYSSAFTPTPYTVCPPEASASPRRKSTQPAIAGEGFSGDVPMRATQGVRHGEKVCTGGASQRGGPPPGHIDFFLHIDFFCILRPHIPSACPGMCVDRRDVP